MNLGFCRNISRLLMFCCWHSWLCVRIFPLTIKYLQRHISTEKIRFLIESDVRIYACGTAAVTSDQTKRHKVEALQPFSNLSSLPDSLKTLNHFNFIASVVSAFCLRMAAYYHISCSRATKTTQILL